MRHLLLAVTLSAVLVSGCSPSPPSVLPTRATASPTESLSPAATPSHAATSSAASATATDDTPSTEAPPSGEAFTPPPLVYDWSKFPRLPAPALSSGRASVPASAVAGCVTHIFEPKDDPSGRVAQSDAVCLTGDLPQTAPLVVAPRAALAVRAPAGYVLGAEVVDGGETYSIASALHPVPAKITGITGSVGAELARETGFGLDALAFAAPAAPGDYLVSVASQLGMRDRTFRELGTIFLYRLRVAAP